MSVLNMYFKKREEQRVTYKRWGRCTQRDYILCKMWNLKDIGNWKVVSEENVIKQHQMVVCRMPLYIKKRKQVKAEARSKWKKLKKEECCTEFRKKLRHALGGKKELPDDWESTALVLTLVFGGSSGHNRVKQTWWWNDEVHETIGNEMKQVSKEGVTYLGDEENR